MGQYYQAFNVDKREYLSPHDFDNGAKLMEFSYRGNSFIRAVQAMLNGHWKGDRVYSI